MKTKRTLATLSPICQNKWSEPRTDDGFIQTYNTRNQCKKKRKKIICEVPGRPHIKVKKKKKKRYIYISQAKTKNQRSMKNKG